MADAIQELKALAPREFFTLREKHFGQAWPSADPSAKEQTYYVQRMVDKAGYHPETGAKLATMMADIKHVAETKAVAKRPDVPVKEPKKKTHTVSDR